MATSARIPIHDATAPLVCTITEAEVPERIELLERMRAALGRVERTEHGLLLHFPREAALEADLRRFAADEKQCCRFWGFEVGAMPESLTLRWDGPSAAAEILDEIQSFFEGDAPFTLLSGLL